MITDSLTDRACPQIRAAQPARWTPPAGVRLVKLRGDTGAIYQVRVYRRGARQEIGRTWRHSWWHDQWDWTCVEPDGSMYNRYNRDWPQTPEGQTRAWQFGVERIAAEFDLYEAVPRGYAIVRAACDRQAKTLGVPRVPTHFSIDLTWHAMVTLATVAYGANEAERASLDCGFGFSIYPCGLEVYVLDCLPPHYQARGYEPRNPTSWAMYIAGSTLVLRSKGQGEREQAFYWVASADADPSDPTSVELVGMGVTGATVVLARLREAGNTLRERDRLRRERQAAVSGGAA